MAVESPNCVWRLQITATPLETLPVCLSPRSPPVPPNGVDLSVELSGESAGYIAVGLTANASEGTSMLFICAQNSSDNGTFFFRTMQMNNTSNMLTPTERRVKEIRGWSSEDTTFFVLLGNGSFDGSDFGLFIRLLDSKPLDLTKPDSNPHAVLLLLSVLTLSVLLRV
ncbi:Cyclin-B2-1 [Dissostichus eleginoides]|uniref:Cyclin-B2-1 n=1 Tax=Dissostichus eleginoides TaxID=100907 RepID=A0AAD9B7T0_DISEL|nr:Cyclin-B2-1 [Dissostichus eleginoides]